MGTSSIEKALLILKALSKEDGELGNLELCRRLGIHRATVNTILHKLKSSDFVHQNPLTRKYHLGVAAVAIGTAASLHISAQLASTAQKYLDRLRDLTGETVSLEVISGKEVIVVYRAPSPNPVGVDIVAGESVPIHASAEPKRC